MKSMTITIKSKVSESAEILASLPKGTYSITVTEESTMQEPKPTRTYTRHRTRSQWTPARVGQLLTLRKERRSWRRIGKIMGLSTGAVAAKYMRILSKSGISQSPEIVTVQNS